MALKRSRGSGMQHRLLNGGSRIIGEDGVMIHAKKIDTRESALYIIYNLSLHEKLAAFSADVQRVLCQGVA